MIFNLRADDPLRRGHIVAVEAWKLEDQQLGSGLLATSAAVAVLGMSDGLVQGTLFGLVSQMPPKYAQVRVCLLQIFASRRKCTMRVRYWNSVVCLIQIAWDVPGMFAL